MKICITDVSMKRVNSMCCEESRYETLVNNKNWFHIDRITFKINVRYTIIHSMSAISSLIIAFFFFLHLLKRSCKEENIQLIEFAVPSGLS